MLAVFFCSRGNDTSLHQRPRDGPLSSQAVCEYQQTADSSFGAYVLKRRTLAQFGSQKLNPK